MPIDAYQPCPCGSGKKLKFCCSDLVADMSKVQRLQENEQFRLALQTLEQLEQQHPNNPWVATTHASILLQDDEAEEAVPILERLLEAHPDHVFAIALNALTRFAARGFEDSRPAVYRAFQRAAHAFPDVVGGLAMGIATSMLARGKFLAARAHLVLTMRLVPEAERESVFVRLLEFEGDREIPYPLRSVHALAAYAADDSIKQEAERARRLADIGCWGASAQLYAQIAEKDADSSALWQNLGLCRAWNGDEVAAAEALHRAARLQDDFPLAVELETIAQLLDQTAENARDKIEILEYPVNSVSKLLTLLDASRRLARIPLPPSSERRDSSEVATYVVLDRERNDEESAGTASLEDLPTIVANVGVFDAHSEGGEQVPAHAFLSAYTGEHLELARRLFEEAAGDEAGALQSSDDDDLGEFASVPREHACLLPRLYFPKSVSISAREQLTRESWRHAAFSVWPETSLQALDGKTPSQAAGDPALKLPLTAALYALDTLCESNQYTLDLPALAESLQIAALPAIEPDDSLQLNHFSSMQLNRLDVAKLSDDQLIYTLNRALLIHHSRFLYGILQEVLKRPPCHDKVDLNRVYWTLSDLARDRNRPDESLEWTHKGLEHARTQKDSFEDVFRWELRELVTRLRNPDDPDVGRLIARMRDYYGPKLPNFEAYLQAILNAYGAASAAAADAILTAAGEPTPTGGAVWTPDAAAGAEEGAKKLWLPGQQ